MQPIPNLRPLIATAALACAAAVSGVGVVAQEPDSVRPFRLPPLVVSVLRTPIELRSVPFAVSIRGESELQEGKAGASLEEALQGLPGVHVQNRFNYAVGERVAVRGFGSRSQFGVRGVKVVVDGIPATLPDGQSTLDHLDLGSLGRVEALRGPGSALYGNAAGGVLLFRTRIPADTPFRQEARAVVGSHGLTRVQATSSGRIGGTGYFLNLSHLGFDGFRTNPLDPRGEPYGRADRAHLNGRFSTPMLGGRLDVTLNAVDLDAENPGSLSDSLLSIGDRRAFEFNVRQRTAKEVLQGQVGLSWVGSFSAIETELTLYGILRSTDNPIPSAVIDLDRRASGLRAVLGRGSGATHPVGWATGIDVELQKDDRRNYENVGGMAGELFLDQQERVRTVGLFVQGNLPLGSRLRLAGGLRYDRFRFQVEDRFLEGDPDDSGSRTMDALSPTFGLHLQLGENLSAFGNVATSFETPTTTELVNRPQGPGGFNPELEPQTGVGLELGLRGFRGESTYEVAAFSMDLDDELVPFEVPDEPGRRFFRNAGTSRRRGLEATLSIQPRPWLRTQIAYTFVDATSRDFEVDGQDLGGNRIPGLAPHRLEVISRASEKRGSVELRVQYVDAMPVNDLNTASSPSHWLADLRLGMERLPVGWAGVRPFLGITNLTGETYNASVVVNAFGGRFFEPGPGRAYYVGISADFGG
jgi:iron complex outermembrane receptor protein